MIHIATVHFEMDEWVDLQINYLRTHLNDDIKIYAFLDNLSRDHTNKFDYVCKEQVNGNSGKEVHPKKLNMLADIICDKANSDNDFLMFLDSDAIPIKNPMPFVLEKLKSYPLLAIQRLENLGDLQPHPSFCITTVGFWKRIEGDWNYGFEWRDNTGAMVSEPGANLMKILNENSITWYPLLRTNKINIHPILFGIYDDIIYHHGAGSRNCSTRKEEKPGRFENFLVSFIERVSGAKFSKKFKKKLTQSKKKIIHRKNKILSNFMKEKVKKNKYFYRRLIKS